MSLLPTGDGRPLPRHSHVAWMYQEHMFILGGYARGPFKDTNRANKVMLKDVWAFNMRTRTWARIGCTGITTSPRADMGEPPFASSLSSHQAQSDSTLPTFGKTTGWPL